MDTEVKVERQLQFWNPALKRYTVEVDMADVLRGPNAAQDHARSVSRSWRICRADRDLKGPAKRAFMTSKNVHDARRPVEDVQRDYLRWAQAKGLSSITMYNSRPAPNFEPSARKYFYQRRPDLSKPLYTGDVQYITVEKQFTVEQSPDWVE